MMYTVGGLVGHPHGSPDLVQSGRVEYRRRTPGSASGVAYGPDVETAPVVEGVVEDRTLAGGDWIATVRPDDPQYRPWSIGFTLTGDVTLADATPITVNGETWARGERGASAYELAVEQGYTGTVTEWLASLTATAHTVTVRESSPGVLAVDGPAVRESSPGVLSLDARDLPKDAWSRNPQATRHLTSVQYDPVTGRLYSGWGNWTVNGDHVGIVSHDLETGLATVEFDRVRSQAVERVIRLSDGLYVPHIDTIGVGTEDGSGHLGYAVNRGGGWVEEGLPGRPIHVFDMAETSHGLWAAGSGQYPARSGYPTTYGPVLWHRPAGGEWEVAYRDESAYDIGASWGRFYRIHVEDDRAVVRSLGMERPLVTLAFPGGAEVESNADFHYRPEFAVTVGMYTYKTGPEGLILRSAS